MIETDVAVVGAGPAGLLLAGDLAEAGLDVTLLERRSAQRSPLTRAFVVLPRTLEQFDARGIAEELLQTGSRLVEMHLYRRLRIDMSVLATRFPYMLLTPQYQTEDVLRRRAERLGVRFEWNTEVSGLDHDADGVEVRAGARRWRAQYLVGADGAHSTVRHLVGEPFPGRSAVQSVMLADVRFDHQPDATMRSEGGRAGFAFHVPFGDGWYRVIAWNRADERPVNAPVTLDEIRHMLRVVYGTDHGLAEARWLSRFDSDERQVGRYRIGRVLLVGDAAHVHTPAGGQGMNLGLQDAANLGWRLVATLRGYGPAHDPSSVLNGYHDERHPVGQAVLRSSAAMMRVATTRSAPLRALRTARLGGITAHRTAPRAAAEAIAGLGISYSPPPSAAHPVTHRDRHRIGDRVADLPLSGGGRLYEALRGRDFVLIRGGDHDDADTAAAAARAGWRGSITEVASATPLGTDLLVRPDGYLAWAS